MHQHTSEEQEIAVSTAHVTPSVHMLQWHEVLLLVRAVCLGCAAMFVTLLQAGICCMPRPSAE